MPITALPPNLTEGRLQQNCVTWFKNTYRQHRDLLYMVNNDGRKNAVAAAQDKAMGLTPGIPDLHLAIAANGFHSLYIELKSATGRVSPEQAKVHEQLQAQGHCVAVVRSENEFRALLEDYMAKAGKVAGAGARVITLNQR